MLVEDFIRKYPDSSFRMMTPGGFVELTPEQANALLAGERVRAQPGDSECAMEIDARELLQESVESVNWENGVCHMMTGSPQEPEQEERGKEDMTVEREKEKKLKERLKANYESYIQKLRQKPAEDLIGMASEIAAAKIIYEELSGEGGYGEYTDYLLQFEDPLEVLRENWQGNEGYALYMELDHMLYVMQDKQIGVGDYPMAEGAGESPQNQEVVMC